MAAHPKLGVEIDCEARTVYLAFRGPAGVLTLKLVRGGAAAVAALVTAAVADDEGGPFVVEVSGEFEFQPLKGQAPNGSPIVPVQ